MNTRSTPEAADSPYMDRCLSFTVSGPWGHFKRPEGNVAKRTFRIIPRTTAAGLMAAIIGVGRDSYYDVFQQDSAGVAITPVTEPRTMPVPEILLSTTDDDFINAGLAQMPDPSVERQRHSIMMLRNPAYRIDVTLSDSEFYSELKHNLEEGKSVYTPSLGISECLADITYHGEHQITDPDETGVASVDSVIPDASDAVVPDTEREYATEHSPAVMESLGGGERHTIQKTSVTFAHDAEPVEVRGVSPEVVEDDNGNRRRVMFF